MNYRKYSDTEYVWADSSVLITSIAFYVSYDYDDTDMPGMILKHGPIDNIKVYEKEQLDKINKMLSIDVFKNTKFFVVDVTDIAKVDINEVNKCIQITGYVGTFLKKFNLLPSLYDEHEEVE